MRRREFITALAARAQPTAKIARIGLLGVTTPSDAESRLERFRTGLRDLGYVEGKNIFIGLPLG
jgi:putative ABC transport system substrate-binding protein